MVCLVDYIAFEGLAVDFGGLFGIVSHGLAYDGQGYVVLACCGSPGVAADVGGELQPAEHGTQGVETGVVASQCIAVLMIDGVRVACLCEYGEKVVCIGGPAVHDCLHHGFDLYVDALLGLMKTIDNA